LSQANEYLSQAQWTVLKTPECGNEIKSRLYRNLGLLEAARKNYFDALSHLSNDVRYDKDQSLNIALFYLLISIISVHHVFYP
jgi:hypothetical protein